MFNKAGRNCEDAKVRKICELHDKAMLIMNDAYLLKNANKCAEAKAKLAEACALELKSAARVVKLPESEPSRSILYLCAASLAWHAENFDLAERLIGEGMSEFTPQSLKIDFLRLHDDVMLSIAAKNSAEILRGEEAKQRN
jgi:hypothetical protein